MIGKRTSIAAAGALAAALALTACGSGGSGGSNNADSTGDADGSTLTLYNGQHESTTKLMVDDFTKATGIKVKVRSGEDAELANQILQEGSASPADVIYTENSPALSLLSEKGMLAPADPTALAAIPATYNSPNNDWVGVAGREVVLEYNPKKVSDSELPASILDVGGPSWHGKVGIAPSGADFQTIVAAVVAAVGKEKGTAWLEGLKRVGQAYGGNSAILQAVNRGDIPFGISYHYYWFRDQAESGGNSGNVKLHYFGNQDPGAFMSVSGVGVLKSSKHKAAADKLVQFLTGKQGQTDLAESDDFEYPLNPSVPANPKLKPLDQLGVPTDLGPGKVGDATEAVTLLQQVGLL